jgi:hypothetical protein
VESQKEVHKNFTELTEEFQISDPKIIIAVDELTISPNYLNYSFISNFPCLVAIFYLMGNTSDSDTILLGLLGVIIFLYSILNQLISLNKSVINKKNKSITLFPNFFLKMIGNKNQIIDNREIKRIYYKPDSFSLVFRRFVLKVILENNQTINLISTREETVAKKLVDIYSFHF